MSAGAETCLLQCVLLSGIFKYPARAVVPLARKTVEFYGSACCPQQFGKSVNLFTNLRAPEEDSYGGSLFRPLAVMVLGFKALKMLLRICRVCVKVGNESSCSCCPLYVPCRSCKKFGIGGFWKKPKKGWKARQFGQKHRPC